MLTPWFTEKVVAFVVVQESVEESPAVIETGSAESVHVGAEGSVTVTVVSQVTVPPAAVAVMV